MAWGPWLGTQERKRQGQAQVWACGPGAKPRILCSCVLPGPIHAQCWGAAGSSLPTELTSPTCHMHMPLPLLPSHWDVDSTRTGAVSNLSPLCQCLEQNPADSGHPKVSTGGSQEGCCLEPLWVTRPSGSGSPFPGSAGPGPPGSTLWVL